MAGIRLGYSWDTAGNGGAGLLSLPRAAVSALSVGSCLPLLTGSVVSSEELMGEDLFVISCTLACERKDNRAFCY